MTTPSKPKDDDVERVATYAPSGFKWASVDQHDCWLLRFADQDRGDQWFGGADYEPGEAQSLAVEAWNRFAPAWSVRLMRTVTLDEVRSALSSNKEDEVERVALVARLRDLGVHSADQAADLIEAQAAALSSNKEDEVAEEIEEVCRQMEYAVGNGMSWIDHSEAAEFVAKLRRIAMRGLRP